MGFSVLICTYSLPSTINVHVQSGRTDGSPLYTSMDLFNTSKVPGEINRGGGTMLWP